MENAIPTAAPLKELLSAKMATHWSGKDPSAKSHPIKLGKPTGIFVDHLLRSVMKLKKKESNSIPLQGCSRTT